MIYFIKSLNFNPYLGIIIFKTKLTHGKPLCTWLLNFPPSTYSGDSISIPMFIEAKTRKKCEGERNTETETSFMSFYVPFSLRLLVPLERSDIIQAPCDTKSCSCMEWRQTIIWTYPIPVSISPECIVNAPFMKSISYLFHVKWPLSPKTLTWHEKM